MTELLFTAEPELRRPGLFLRRAVADGRSAARPSLALFVATLHSRHRRAWLGYLWLAIPGLIAAGFATFAQAQGVLSFRETAMPYPLYAFFGMMLWQGFFDALVAPLEQLGRSRQLITRSLSNHEIVLGAALLMALANASIRLVLIAIALLVFAPHTAATVWLLPAGMLVLVILGFGLGLFAAPLGLLYDDVERLVFTAAGFLFFVTPVLYPLPATRWFQFNPVAVLLTAARGWITGAPPAQGFALVTALSALILICGWLIYRLARPHVVARLG